jgi:hypothetical protein
VLAALDLVSAMSLPCRSERRLRVRLDKLKPSKKSPVTPYLPTFERTSRFFGQGPTPDGAALQRAGQFLTFDLA